MSYVSLGRFAPINQEGDKIDLDSVLRPKGAHSLWAI